MLATVCDMPFPPPKQLLLTPGPTPVPPDVVAAMAEPLPHHRTPEFKARFGSVLERLKGVFRTSQDVMLFTASGTGAFESAYANLLSPGDRVLVVSAGNFGERWVKMAQAFGAEVEAMRVPWGERPDPDAIAERVVGRDDLALVVVVHSETSTGSVLDLQAVAERTRERSALLVVDAISSLGAAPLETDAWGLDVVVTGSQKALMLPPGLAFTVASERALERSRTATSPRFYFDWQRTLDAQRKGPQSAFTPAISLVLGLDAALARIEAAGLEALWERTRAMGTGVRAAARALGLELVSPDHPDCGLVTAIAVPDGIDGDALRLGLRDRHGIVVAGGQGELKGRIIRYGAFGFIEPLDLVAGIHALELELLRHGHVVELGTGVGAFSRAVDAVVPVA
jgi:aspartate aminotransferase-like enzyme